MDVFFERLDYLAFIEAPAYTEVQLISDMGISFLLYISFVSENLPILVPFYFTVILEKHSKYVHEGITLT